MTAFAPRSTSRSNRRRQPRLDVDAPARLVAGATELAGRIENISAGGASFLTPQIEPELPVGGALTLVVSGVSDDGTDLECPSRVIRTDVLYDSSGEQRCYALAFDRPIDELAGADADPAPGVAPPDAAK